MWWSFSVPRRAMWTSFRPPRSKIHRRRPPILEPPFKAYTRGGPNLPDSISLATAKAKGKTIVIRTPADFAKAIEQIEHRGGAGR